MNFVQIRINFGFSQIRHKAEALGQETEASIIFKSDLFDNGCSKKKSNQTNIQD